MASSPAAPFVSLRGSQKPRVSWHPPYASSSGPEFISLARLAGVELDPWQQTELTHALGESPDWKCPKCTHRAAVPIKCPVHPFESLIHPWAAFEVTNVVPRQNGKSELLIARMLGGLFILEEPLQIYSAHLFDTAMEIFRRLVFLIENCDELRAEVKHRGSKLVGIKNSHGEEGVELRCGARIRFKARTGGGGRGFSCDTLYLDEAMILRELFLGATVPTLSARANPQIYLAGSAPDQQDPSHDGLVLSKRRSRALAGGDPSLAYFEHSAEGESPDEVDDEILDDPAQWALANPGMGIRITSEYIRNEKAAMGTRQFAVERLGIGDWPDAEEGGYSVISAEKWNACEDLASKGTDPACFGLCVTPDRRYAVIGVASVRDDGFFHVGVHKHAEGTDWVAGEVADLVGKYGAISVQCMGGSAPSASLIPALAALGIGIEPANSSDLARSSGVFFDLVDQNALRHRGTPDLRAALKGAEKRKLTEGWAWSQTLSPVDISPLVACTLAIGGLVDAGALSGGMEW